MIRRPAWEFIRRSRSAFEKISKCIAESADESVHIDSSLSSEQLESRRSFLKHQQKMLGRDL